MKLDRCNNGHMFDTDRFRECPYCKTENFEIEIKEEKINLIDEMEDDDRTTAYWVKDVKIEPVVGWLTCIYGSEKGKDYRIVSERNFIGRSEEMDIRIEGDMSISRKNHCSITYNPKQRIFILAPGEGNGLVYVNNEALYIPKQLETYDLLEIGESKFIFVNLCGQNFDWDKDKINNIKDNI